MISLIYHIMNASLQTVTRHCISSFISLLPFSPKCGSNTVPTVLVLTLTLILIVGPRWGSTWVVLLLFQWGAPWALLFTYPRETNAQGSTLTIKYKANPDPTPLTCLLVHVLLCYWSELSIPELSISVPYLVSLSILYRTIQRLRIVARHKMVKLTLTVTLTLKSNSSNNN